MADLRTSGFWSEEARLLRVHFIDIVARIFAAGAESGVNALPVGAVVLIDWEVINTAAIEWARLYLGETGIGAAVPAQIFDWVNTLTDTQRRRTLASLEAWIRSGEPLPDLEARLIPIFESAKRARQIAVTEVTRVYASGNLTAWASTGMVGGKQWQTARDELVCPLCGPLHNQIVDLEKQFTQSALQLAQTSALQNLVGSDPDKALRRAGQLLRGAGESVIAPPRHVNCRCWLKPIVSIEMVERELERELGLR